EPVPEPAPETAPVPEPVPEPVPAPAPEGTYTVKAGDCLWSISQKAYGTGVKWGVIYNANAAIIKNPSDIQIGQVLVIPAV
ncbi:MAG: LysM peptidoglycan-binding domain-containing protein, partial [Oscillibacter sp.]|nr:LysM peptidoglycan-binding domain-containing protein [Oscillibacter sp.]